MFALLAAGLTGEEIASRLVISPETVRTHIRNGMRRLGARTRVHATSLALQRGEIGLLEEAQTAADGGSAVPESFSPTPVTMDGVELPPQPGRECERIGALLECAVLDTGPERSFDDLTHLAAQICEAPIALVSLVGGDRQFFKSAVGFEASETPRTVSFCAHAVASAERLIVPDTHRDERFASNPVVVGEPGIRSYAGVPLTVGGFVLGTLCVIDRVPRTLSGEQLAALEALGRQAAAQLELRRTVLAREASEKRLRISERRLAEAQRVAQVGSWEWDFADDSVTWSDELYRLHGLVPGEIEPSLEAFLDLVHPDDRGHVSRTIGEAVKNAERFSYHFRLIRKDGAVRRLLAHGEPSVDAAGSLRVMRGAVQDITERREAEERYEFLADIIPQQVWTARPGGDLDFVNNRVLIYFDCDSQTMIRSGWENVVHPEDLPRSVQRWARALATGEPYQVEFRLRDGDGSYRWHIGRALPLRNSDGEIVKWFGTNTDISELKVLEERLRHQADHDALTGLLNRRGFGAELERAVDHAERHGAQGAVLMIDLDHFKVVNDSLGHHAGDGLIQELAVALGRRLRDGDVLGRSGGDEFAVLIPGASEQDAQWLAERLMATVRDKAATLRVTASVGIARYGEARAVTPEEVLMSADIALYEAKDAGRDRARLSSGNRGGLLTWVEKIRRALAEDRLALAAQPIVDLRGGVPREELLVRMVDDEGAVIPPNAFLPVAERFGLIQEIDRWVISRGLRYAAAEKKSCVEINLSARSIGDRGLTQTIEGELAKTGVDPEQVIFEITETAAASNMESARRFADRMATLGCGFALDDFGTGFGSFIYLKNFPVGHLKIDMEFVRDLPRSTTDRRIVQAIVGVAKGLGQKTIAEGVEDAAALDCLRKLDVDFAQGYHLGRPALISDGPAGERHARDNGPAGSVSSRSGLLANART